MLYGSWLIPNYHSTRRKAGKVTIKFKVNNMVVGYKIYVIYIL